MHSKELFLHIYLLFPSVPSTYQCNGDPWSLIRCWQPSQWGWSIFVPILLQARAIGVHRISAEKNNFLSNVDFLMQLWLIPESFPELTAMWGPGMMTGQNSQRTHGGPSIFEYYYKYFK